MRGSESAPRITGVLVTGSAGGGGRDRHGRHALGDQNGQVEHAQPDRDHEEPRIHLAGNPVEADKVLFHRYLTLHPSIETKIDPLMLRCNIQFLRYFK
jgi:hypothetical protein